MTRKSEVARRSRTARVELPFRDLGDRVEIRLSACPWAGVTPDGQVWVSPSLSRETDGYSAGKVEDIGTHVALRGGL